MNPMMIQNNENYFYIKIQNGGGFYAEAYADWMQDGQPHSWNSGWITLGFNASTIIPSTATNLHLTIKVWFYKFGTTVFYQYLPTTQSSCFYLYGSVFNPVCASVPCDDIGSNNSNCCCCNSGCCNNMYCNCCNNICANSSNCCC